MPKAKSKKRGVGHANYDTKKQAYNFRNSVFTTTFFPRLKQRVFFFFFIRESLTEVISEVNHKKVKRLSTLT